MSFLLMYACVRALVSTKTDHLVSALSRDTHIVREHAFHAQIFRAVFLVHTNIQEMRVSALIHPYVGGENVYTL
jgi:hypothetical protein